MTATTVTAVLLDWTLWIWLRIQFLGLEACQKKKVAGADAKFLVEATQRVSEYLQIRNQVCVKLSV